MKVLAPINENEDVVDKKYVDTKLPLAGGAMTGAITRDFGSGTIANINLYTATGSTDGFKVDYDATTADAGTTKLYTTDDANAKLSLGNNVGGTYKEAISIVNGSATITGSVSGSAATLTTPRTIGIGTGATGTATSFNGSSNITIPITDVKDAYVTWGGKSIAGNISPDDAGCVDEFGHNKLAFLPADCITVEYTTDGGSTWVDYGLTNAQKISLVTTSGPSIQIGKGTVRADNGTLTNENCSNYKARVKISTRRAGATNGILYTAARKWLINMTSNGAGGCKCLIEYRTIANYNNNVDTWVTAGTYDINGWSGWNSIPHSWYSTFGGGSNQTSQIADIRFTLSITSVNTSFSSLASFIDFRLIGTTNWNMPSELARAGHLYTMDVNQNATFPANLSAKTIDAAKLSGTIPSNCYTNTTYSAGMGMELSGTSFISGIRWNAVTQGQKWSRICLITPSNSVEGTSGLLSVSCTRGNVVCNATFLVTTHHSKKATITELAGADYSNFRIRCVVNAGGACYIEIYDTAASIASGTAQTWHCTYVPLLGSTVTKYTAFTDGTTVPSDYTAVNDFTTTGGNASLAIKDITRSGTTFTATRQNGTTFTFTQQDNNTIPAAYCDTAAGTAAKTASCTGYALAANTYLHIIIVNSNTSAGALTLNVNGKGAKPIYINEDPSGSTNYTLPAGSYICYYDGATYHFNTDGKLPHLSGAAYTGVDTTLVQGSASTNVPTSAAVVNYINSMGYGANNVYVGTTEPVSDDVQLWVNPEGMTVAKNSLYVAGAIYLEGNKLFWYE